MLMKCAWDAYLNLLPGILRREVDRYGKNTLQELRLRLGQPPELRTDTGSRWLNFLCTGQDLDYCINAASRYSPWTAGTASMGYLTGSGGHRIGICGRAAVRNGTVQGIHPVTSLCLRVARDFPGFSGNACALGGSVLILGPPGSGKTTFLRDLIRQKSDRGTGCISVVDEKQEIFPESGGVSCFPAGKHTDIMGGCPKAAGIDAVLRNMGPSVIAVDEITAEQDCEALIRAAWCGVSLIATAHAATLEDLNSRPVYRSLVACGVFEHVIVLRPDRSWTEERMES